MEMRGVEEEHTRKYLFSPSQKTLILHDIRGCGCTDRAPLPEERAALLERLSFIVKLPAYHNIQAEDREPSVVITPQANSVTIQACHACIRLDCEFLAKHEWNTFQRTLSTVKDEIAS